MSALATTATPVERIALKRVPRDTITLARWLLGKVLVSELRGVRRSGRIVETEAYLQREAACHGYRGITPRNRSLFKDRGHAYVYVCYGTSLMLNLSSESAGIGSGVLLRALEPLTGIAQMSRGRGHVRPVDLARGPGRLAAAMRIGMRHDGLNLFEDPKLWIGSDGFKVRSNRIGVSTHIGLTKAAHEPLRFFLLGSRHVSGTKLLNAGTPLVAAP